MFLTHTTTINGTISNQLKYKWYSITVTVNLPVSDDHTTTTDRTGAQNFDYIQS